MTSPHAAFAPASGSPPTLPTPGALQFQQNTRQGVHEMPGITFFFVAMAGVGLLGATVGRLAYVLTHPEPGTVR